jgi:hypothetical protein
VSADQISVKLTMADELSSKAKDGRAELKRLEAEMKQVREELVRTGKGGEQLERLEKSYREVRAEVRRNTTEANKLRAAVRQTGQQATTSAKQATTAWQRFRKTMGSGLVTGASIAGVVYFGKRAVEAFAEAERGQLQLQQAMEKFPAINDVTAASFAALNTQLMNTTGADDDLLAAAEGILARFRLTGAEIQRLIPLVNDYAIATGRDVPTAATSIGRALMGNARALKELGIDFTATGDRSRDLEQILGALERKVGGVGEAFGETTAGKLAIAQQNFGNLQEEIGAALVPALESLVSIVRPISEAFAAMDDSSKKIVVGLTAVGTAALILGPRLIALRAQLAMINTAGAGMVGIGKGGVKAAAGIAAVTAAMTYAATAEDHWMEGGGHLKDYATDFERAGVAFRAVIDPSAVQRATNFAEGVLNFFAPVKTSLEANKEALAAFDKSLADLVTSGNPDEAARQFAHQYKWASQYGATTEDLMELLPGYAAAIENTADASREAATWTGNLTAAQRTAKGATDDLTKSLDGVNRALERRAAMDAYSAALKAFIEDPTDETAAAVSSAMTTAAAAIDKPAKRAKFVTRAVGEIKTAAKDGDLKLNRGLEDSLTRAQRKADDVTTAIEKIPTSRTIDIYIRRHGKQIPGTEYPFADGGLVVGPGTGTSDSIPARLSNGEFVVRAAAVRAIGVNNLEALNHADRPTFTAPQLTLPTVATPTVTPAAGGPTITIGEIHAESGIDVQSEILWAMRRAERIRRERSAA